MSRKYLIDRKIHFDTASNILSCPENESMQAITLNTPAGRCLQLIIERRPSLVMHHAFYDYIWGEHAKSVPSNTLYQNISLARKGLRYFGEEYKDLIITVPRKGFKLNDAILIEEITDPVASTKIPYHIENKNSFDVSEQSNHPQKIKKISSFFKLTFINLMMLFILVNLLFNVAVWQLSDEIKTSASFDLNTFDSTYNLGDCNFYSNRHISWKLNQTDLNKFHIDCKQTPYVYMIHYKFSRTKNILTCKEKLQYSVSPVCFSYHIME